ncbi:hypothetical protein GTP41_14515 [Pseudoduganella sp. DS3]|uniref:Uncharacterized protein n=1 Tax=Pseudoduganella guangdongensis TaxID=2692179 RepID=A0A6N9HJ48_9BURK|nr:hypothetical protein [Pseudoduganella guangdongensis]MYN03307.1 hypothetical protein [Pseudoduganella guangdongensis]
MSKSNITISGKTLWYQDDPFAIWLRVMALNLKSYRSDDHVWTYETADSWMSMTKMLGVSNVMGVDLDVDFDTFQKAWVLRNIVKRIREIINQLDDGSLDLVARAIGLNVSCSIEEVQEIHNSVEAMLIERLEFLRSDVREV